MALHEREAERAGVDGRARVHSDDASIGSARVCDTRVGRACVGGDARVHRRWACIHDDTSVGHERTCIDEGRHRSAAEHEQEGHERALHRHSAGLFNDAVMLRTTERGDTRSDWYAR